MKYCVNGRQPLSILKQADEIRFQENDLERIFDLIEDMSDKTIIYEMVEDFSSNKKDMNTLHMYNEKFSNFYIEARDIFLMDLMTKKGFKCFWHYPVHSFYELKGLLEHEPKQIILGEPLCFDLEIVKNIVKEIPLRMTANYAYEPYLLRENGICGSWIRPEDVEKYEPYISSLDFYGNDLKKEATLLKIYSQDKMWPGNLNLLLSYLDFNVDNRAIPEDLAIKRLNCGQRCMRTGNCHACDTAFRFAESMRKLHESQQQIVEN